MNLCLKLKTSGADGSSAFCVLPLKKSSWAWVIMKAVNPATGRLQYFVDKCLPFGSSISCSHFQRVSNCLKHLIQYQVGRTGFLLNYLDDFLFLAKLLIECNNLLQKFMDLCAEIGFPLSLDKT